MDNNLEQWLRDDYLNSIEAEDKATRYSQVADASDGDEFMEEREFKQLKWEESLSAHGLHII